MVKYILKIDPAASPEKAEQLAKVWDEVVSSIIEEMLARARPHMDELHIDLREEMALELAKLIVFISEKVAADRMSGRVVNDIDPEVEREQCFNLEGKEKISNTIHHHHWEPGDAVVWDNRRLMHQATPWPMHEPRIMYHARIAGDRLSEFAAPAEVATSAE